VNTELASAVEEATRIAGDVDKLVRMVLSGQRKGMTPPAQRIEMRPVLLKGIKYLQIIENDGKQATTKNWNPNELNLASILNSGFSSMHIDHVDGSYSVRVTKKETVLVNRKKLTQDQNLDHDRQKNRLLDASDPYLREVGIADSSGQIKPSRQDKYRQVEEFLRLLVPTLDAAIAAGHVHQLTQESPLRIVDLGCGSAYLTFAVHQYFQSKATPVQVTGIDIREDSREKNSAVASKLGISASINFVAQEISQAEVNNVDVVMALHACDTATDDAIAWAVNHEAKVILVAPCCHHDLQAQISDPPEPWKLVTKNGLLKERFADLLTDALRAQILKLVGYRTEVIEFIGDAHTPRNLMIRGVRTNAPSSERDRVEYQNMVTLWKIRPALADRLDVQMKGVSSEF
jgi:SAM-dependent methyltransferase